MKIKILSKCRKKLPLKWYLMFYSNNVYLKVIAFNHVRETIKTPEILFNMKLNSFE